MMIKRRRGARPLLRAALAIAVGVTALALLLITRDPPVPARRRRAPPARLRPASTLATPSDATTSMVSGGATMVGGDGDTGLPRLPARLARGRVYLTDAVLVPRGAPGAPTRAQLLLVALTAQSFSVMEKLGANATNHDGVRVAWRGGGGRPYRAFTVHPCDAFPAVALLRRRAAAATAPGGASGSNFAAAARAVSCRKIKLVAGNIGGPDKIALALYEFDPVGGGGGAQGYEGDVAALELAPGERVAFDPRTRAAGFFRHSRRLQPPPKPARPSSTASPSMSVCIEWVTTPPDRLRAREIVAHYARSGFAHVYVGVGGPDVARALAGYRAALASPWRRDGFVSLVPVAADGVDFLFAPAFFLEPCLYHAKGAGDALVGVWDVDELPVVLDPARDGYDVPALLARMAADTRGDVNSGAITYDRAVVDKAAWDAGAGRASGARWRGRVRALDDVCHFILASYAVERRLRPDDGRPADPRAAAAAFAPGGGADAVGLGAAFPVRTRRYGYYGHGKFRYQKAVAVAATTMAAEVHKHTNCAVVGKGGKKRVWHRTAPHDRRLLPDPGRLALFHFLSMWGPRLEDRLTGKWRDWNAQVASEYTRHYPLLPAVTGEASGGLSARNEVA